MLKGEPVDSKESILRLGLVVAVAIVVSGGPALLLAHACYIESLGRVIIAANVSRDAYTRDAYGMLFLSAIAVGALCGRLYIGRRIVWPALVVPIAVGAVAYSATDCCFEIPPPILILSFGIGGTYLGWSLVRHRAGWSLNVQRAGLMLRSRRAEWKAAAVIVGAGTETVVFFVWMIIN